MKWTGFQVGSTPKGMDVPRSFSFSSERSFVIANRSSSPLSQTAYQENKRYNFSTSTFTPSPLKIMHVTDSNFAELIERSMGTVILDCHAVWCRPCKVLSPILEKAVASTNGKVQMAVLGTPLIK